MKCSHNVTSPSSRSSWKTDWNIHATIVAVVLHFDAPYLCAFGQSARYSMPSQLLRLAAYFDALVIAVG